MIFFVRDFRDLIALLEKQPEWRAKIRRMILAEEMLDLPGAIQSLTEGQEKSDASIHVLAKQMQGLTKQIDHL